MARLRTLKPGFFLNEDLANLDPIGRLLFAGLWCLADRRGRLEDRPRRIKAELLPYDDCDVDRLLTQLHEHGFVLRYASDGRPCLQIINFEKHQQPHYKEPDSIIPPPLGHVDGPEITFGVSPEQRTRILARDGGRCRVCSTTERLSIDHIIPRSRGGSGEDDNLQVLCLSCNASKNNRLAADMAPRPTPRSSHRDAGASSAQGRPDVEPTSNQAQVYQSGALPSVFGLPSSVFCEPSSVLCVESRARAREDDTHTRNETFVHQFGDALCAEFADRLGGDAEVRRHITLALNDRKSLRQIHLEPYVRDWLIGDVHYLEEHRNGTAQQFGNRSLRPPGRTLGGFAPPRTRPLTPERLERYARAGVRSTPV